MTRGVTLVWRTDVHLADFPPQSRVDDWTSILLGKLDQVGKVAKKVGAHAVIDGGDLFHVKSPSRNSHELVGRVAAVHATYSCPVYGCVGNHDVKYGSMDFLDESPLGVLFGTGSMRRLYNQHEAVFTNGGVTVRVVGIPYHGTVYDMERFRSIVKGDEDYLVVVAHVLASSQGGSMYESEDIISYKDLINTDPDVWCFLPGTRVIDAQGCFVSIEDIQENQMLMSRSGFTTVNEKHPVRFVDEEVVCFDVEGLPSSLMPGVTLEHPFWVCSNMSCRLSSRKNRRCHPDKPKSSYPCVTCKEQPQVIAGWTKAGDIKDGDYVAVPVPDVPNTPNKGGLARLVGLYLAEGHLIENRHKDPTAGVAWSFHIDEVRLHKDVEVLVKDFFGLGVEYHYHRESNSVQVCAYGFEISDFFLNIAGRYSDQKELSDWVWGLSFNDRLDLLLGWLDGDGYARNPSKYNRVKTEVSGCTVSENMASQIYLLALSIGLRPFYNIRPEGLRKFKKGQVSPGKKAHILSFYGQDAIKLASCMGVRIPETTKTKISGFFRNGLYFVKVKSTKRFLYTGPVYNMRTSTNEYVAGYLLTHNCFGHWHKNQGIDVVGDKHIVNIGSLSRGSLNHDDVNRTPACAVLNFTKKEIEITPIPLKVLPASEVFNIEGKKRTEAKEISMDAFVDSLKDTLVTREGDSLMEYVRNLASVDDSIKERAIHYLEQSR